MHYFQIEVTFLLHRGKPAQTQQRRVVEVMAIDANTAMSDAHRLIIAGVSGSEVASSVVLHSHQVCRHCGRSVE